MAGSCNTQNAQSRLMSWRHVGGVETYFHSFLLLELVQLNTQSHAPATLTQIPIE